MNEQQARTAALRVWRSICSHANMAISRPPRIREAELYRPYARALNQLPGVQSVALTCAAPSTDETWVDNLKRPDHPVQLAEQPPVNLRFINPDYLPTMQITLVSGRNIAAADRANPYVALILERTALEAFSGEDPVGKKINPVAPDDDHPVTVIGVVADTRINGLKDTAAMVYVPY
jgi:hypothetical protein